jgi:Flp pilus assembly protein TadD
VALLERSRALSPEDPNVLCDLGVCYLNSDEYKKAQQLFLQVIKIAPNSEQAHECQNFLKIVQAKMKEDKKKESSTKERGKGE